MEIWDLKDDSDSIFAVESSPMVGSELKDPNLVALKNTKYGNYFLSKTFSGAIEPTQ